MSAQHETPITPAEVDVIVVGAGFSGLYALHRLRQMGLSARVIEAGAGVGGTWYWNRYPGARCDVQSVDYQYSFSPELVDDWTWSERYPSQAELLNYLNHVADRFELRDDIQLNTRVEGLAYDEVAIRWAVSTDQGDQFRARFVILAVGCLSTAKMPEFTGLDDFGGHWYHTGSWPHDGVDFTGKRVAVIGTGSSGIQAIPVIADQAAEVVVFQRTPNYSAPAFNRALSQDDVRSTGADFERGRQLARESYFGFSEPFGDLPGMSVSDEARVEQYEKRWRMGGLSMLGAFDDILTDAAANDTVMTFFADKIREKVNDPAIAERLIPKGYRFGSKRMCVDTNYFETYNRDNVKLVDISADPIDRITHDGVLVGDNEYEVDAIVFATGFDAMTGSLVSIDIRGRTGISLRDKWTAGPRTYLGLATAGFPNMFMVTGPGSPSVLSNMIVSIEQHVEWITKALDHLRVNNIDTIETSITAEDAWVDHVNEVADATVMADAASWYTGANIPGKPRIFMPYIGGVGAYRQICDQVAQAGYDGFVLQPAWATTSA